MILLSKKKKIITFSIIGFVIGILACSIVIAFSNVSLFSGKNEVKETKEIVNSGKASSKEEGKTFNNTKNEMIGKSYSTTTKRIDDYTIFTPDKLGEEGIKHPIITWGNGTNATPSFYTGILEQLASKGYIVVASNSTMTGTGKEMKQGINLMIGENSNKESFFYNSLNIKSIGALGHSQGGSGALEIGEDNRLKCIVTISPMPVSASGIKCPLFIITGSGDSLINSDTVKKMVYNTSTVPTIFAELQGATHFSSTGQNPSEEMVGYILKWFQLYLLDDESLGKTFFSIESEIVKDSDWESIAKNN